MPNSQVQDKLCCFLGQSAPGAGRAEQAAAAQVARCDTSSSYMKTGLPSCVVAKAGPQVAKATLKAKVKANPKAKAKPQAELKAKAKTHAQVTLPQRIGTPPSNGRINTSPSPSSDSDLDIVAVGAAAGPAPAVSASALCPRRPYNAGRSQQATFYMEFLGKHVPFQAARGFTGVGLGRLYIQGRSNGIKRRCGATTAPMMASVLPQRWQLHHSVGKGMACLISSPLRTLALGLAHKALPLLAMPCPILTAVLVYKQGAFQATK